MNFENWMQHRGLSQSSVMKYEGAISGALSEWAMDNGLLSGPLTSITSRAHFEAIAEIIRALPIYQERNERGHSMYNSALNQFANYLSEGYESDIEADVDSIMADPLIGETEKTSLIKSRIGQGTFRQKLVAYWRGCSVTGYSDTNLLVASHIKPWSASSNAERLDVFNGLLLVPNLDRAFDAGLITFEDDGEIGLSPQLTDPSQLGITPNLRAALAPEHKPFMAFHRTAVFRAT